MTDILERLRALSLAEHDDLSVAEEAADEIERLRARVAALEEALRPFADFGAALGKRDEGCDVLIYEMAGGPQLRLVGDDCRRARAALGESRND